MGITFDSQLPKNILFSEIEHMEPKFLQLGPGACVAYTVSSPVGEGPNEDALLLCSNGTKGVVAVADGVGGSRAGQEASRLALSIIATEVEKALDTGSSLRSSIVDGFEQANIKVMNLGVGAATTLAVIELSGGTVRSYHVGDSFVLVVGQRGKQKYQTIDHSPAGHAVEAGLVSQEEAINHEERHVVTNVIGSEQMRIDIGPTIELSPRDTVVVGTDGVSDNLSFEKIGSLIRKGKLESCATALIEECRVRMISDNSNFPSKPDDCTFALYRQNET